MSFIVVIPARYASSRLPGKPLADICGKTMIQRVYEQAQKSKADKVVVATDDQRIYDHVQSFGGEVCMTKVDHVSGTDRIYEVASILGLNSDDVVVNVQGDEPLIPPENINQVAENLIARADYSASTLCEPISIADQVFDSNVVKVVFDKLGRALYFSRAPMPWSRDQFSNGVPEEFIPKNYYRHIGIYGYRVSLLAEFVSWDASTLELIESLEQLRIMENGAAIHCAASVEASPVGVDTEQDLETIRALF